MGTRSQREASGPAEATGSSISSSSSSIRSQCEASGPAEATSSSISSSSIRSQREASGTNVKNQDPQKPPATTSVVAAQDSASSTKDGPGSPARAAGKAVAAPATERRRSIH